MENYEKTLIDELARLNTQKQEVMKQMREIETKFLKKRLSFIMKSEIKCVNWKNLDIILKSKFGITIAVIMIGMILLTVLLTAIATRMK